MVNWFLETGVYVLGVALIPGVGLLLICWGLWGDRSKGRTRCPQCWYDMRGSLPRLECPECGHAPGNVRRLYRNRRGWQRIVIGVFLVLMSSYPLTIIGGWYREQAIMRGAPVAPLFPGAFVTRSGQTWPVGRRLPPIGPARFFARQTTAMVWSDQGLAVCRKLRYLQKIWVISHGSSWVTDAGLEHLKGLPQLKLVVLVNTGVSDAAVARLKQALPNAEVEVLADIWAGSGLFRPRQSPPASP